MPQPKITAVDPMEGCRLLLSYETGEKKTFDVSPYAKGPWFGELADPDYFVAVRIVDKGAGIEWPHGQDVAPHELYELSVPA